MGRVLDRQTNPRSSIPALSTPEWTPGHGFSLLICIWGITIVTSLQDCGTDDLRYILSSQPCAWRMEISQRTFASSPSSLRVPVC